MNVEILKTEHLTEVLKIEKELFSEPWSRFDFEMVLMDISINLILEKNDEIIGYLCSMVMGKDIVHLLNFAIKKKYQGRGIGSLFLSFFLKLIKNDLVLSKVILEVREKNSRAIALYKKFGFVVIDKKEGYYQNPFDDALIMLWDKEKARRSEQ